MTPLQARTDAGGNILIGTASWSDPGFVQHWFPKGLPAGDRLSWYAQHFEMVEINSTFYSIPDPAMAERWCRSTPDRFTFDVKLHRLLSRHSTQGKHLPPKLRDLASAQLNENVKLTPALESAMLDESLNAFESLRRANKLGVFLLQLSPSFSPRKHRLDELDGLIAKLRTYSLALEFRNRNWVVGDEMEATLKFLRDRNVTLVLVDAPADKHFTILPSDLNELTNPHRTYLRLHGRNAQAYLKGKTVATRFDYDYTDVEIVEIADRSRQLAHSAREVHVVFNNNNLDYAPRAASRLRASLGQILNAPPRQTELFPRR